MNRVRCVRITTRVSAWFKANARSLPWRKQPRSGYAAIVSEAMLQQTQVARVFERYRAFMRRFPSLRALAHADEQDVLAMWQGLGYYRRARNLHAAARMIVNNFRGRVPRTIEELLTLPGVGRYTAGAVASIAYGKREPIVDGNVHRVLVRLFAEESRAWRRDQIAWAWDRATELVSHAVEPGSFNEGMMELGATVCLPAPARPRCDQCPLAKMCAAQRLSIQDLVTVVKPRRRLQIVHHHAVVICNHRTGRILLEQRPATGMWANMWQAPTIESESQLTTSQFARQLPLSINSLRPLQQFRYKTTHRAITFHVYTARATAKFGRWSHPDQLHTLAISNAHKRVLKCAGVSMPLKR